MEFSFINNYRDVILININNDGFVSIQPHSKLTVSCAQSSGISVLIKPCGESYVQKRPKAYILKLESSYLFSNVSDGEVFIINREKTKINYNVYYDRLFVNPANAIIGHHKNTVMQEDELKSSYRKSRLIDMLIFEPLLDHVILFSELTAVGILLSIIGGWKVALIYFPLLYIFLFLLNLISDKLVTAFFKNGFGIDDEKSEFYAYFDSGFIENYYRNPQREAYSQDIEVN